jgi:hypothetical protein
MDTSNSPTHLASGNTFHNPGSTCAWKTLASNTLVTNTSSTFLPTLRTKTYDIAKDWKGNLYCGISLSWNYDKQYVDIAMPAYIAKQLLWYEHPHPTKPLHCPYNPNPIKYSQDNQAAALIETSPKLNKANKKRIQQIVGSFLYYARTVNPTIFMALSAIASQQAAPTELLKTHTTA